LKEIHRNSDEKNTRCPERMLCSIVEQEDERVNGRENHSGPFSLFYVLTRAFCTDTANSRSMNGLITDPQKP
jgi:hypothetical protein